LEFLHFQIWQLSDGASDCEMARHGFHFGLRSRVAHIASQLDPENINEADLQNP
jgi:hypothetical protein